LIPLREQNLLFTPEGKVCEKLDSQLFLQWCDLYSLRFLAFNIQRSNSEKKLVKSEYDELTCKRYKEINLEVLGSYLSSYSVDLQNQMVDFPITNYNLHVGITDLIKKII
jgi:hypothetical protein